MARAPQGCEHLDLMLRGALYSRGPALVRGRGVAIG